MKKKVVLCVLLAALFTQKNYSQNQQKLDSLITVLKTSNDDTNKVDVLLSVCKYYFNSSPDTMLNYAKQSLQLSEKLNFDKGRIRSLHAISGYYYITAQYDTALKYLSEAAKIIAPTNDKKGLGDSYANMSSIYKAKGDYLNGIEMEIKALKISEELKDTFRMAAFNNNLGIDLRMQGNLIEALQYCFRALKLREKAGDSTGIANSQTAIGDIYNDQKYFDKALQYYFKALKTAESIKDNTDAAISYFQIATVYDAQNKNDNALKYYSECLALSLKIKREVLVGGCYGGMGNIYLKMGNLDEALSYELKYLKIAQEIEDKNGIANSYKVIAKVYSAKNDYLNAITYAQRSLILFKEMNDLTTESEIYKMIAAINFKRNDFKNAYANLELYSQLNDSVLNIENTKKAAEMEAKYNNEKREKEISLLTKDRQIQNAEIKKQKILKNSLIGGLGLVLVLVFLGYRTFRTRQLLKLQTLRNKIASDLHDDVGSTLSSISIFSELAKEQSSEVTPMLEQIGDNSRKMLDAMADIVWTINPENDQFEKIILRMKSFAYELLGAKKIDFEFEADENVSQLKLPMDVRKNLYLIFKEATNNMVKYSEANKASFSISGNKEKLTMFIRDNGKGFDLNKESHGNGLKNMKKRAQEIGANLLIESEAGTGTTLQLILNLA